MTDHKGVTVTYRYDAGDKLITTRQLSEGGTQSPYTSYLLTDLEASSPYITGDQEYKTDTGGGASESQNTASLLFGDPRGTSISRDQNPQGIIKAATPAANGNLKAFNGSYTGGTSELLSQCGHDVANQLSNAGSAASLSFTATVPAAANSDCVA